MTMVALKNPRHENFCREVAGGLSVAQAWIAAGHSPNSRNMYRLARQAKIEARIAELRREFNQAAGISLRYLQEKLLNLSVADVTRFFEATPDGRLRVRDVTTLPAELRAALSEIRVDADGAVKVKVADKLGAINALLKTLGVPERLELSGPGGAPIEVAAGGEPGGLPQTELCRRLAFACAQMVRDLDDEDLLAWFGRALRELGDRALGEQVRGAPADARKRARRSLAAVVHVAREMVDDRAAANWLIEQLQRTAIALRDELRAQPIERAGRQV
jgi:phage terminase small subunit